MSYIEQARQNRVNAEKAQTLDDLQSRGREAAVFASGRSVGNEDAMRAFEQEILNRFQRQPVAPAVSPGLADSFIQEDIV